MNGQTVTPPKNTTYSVRIPNEVVEDIKLVGRATGLSESAILAEALKSIRWPEMANQMLLRAQAQIKAAQKGLQQVQASPANAHAA